MARMDLTEKGPFSALIDYTKEEEALKAEQQRKQEVQKRIMKANALGEAFRLISEGIGKGLGSNVVQRNANPYILNAVNQYAKADDEYIQRLENLKTKNIALGQADIQYKLGQEQAATERAFRVSMAEKEHAWKAADELDQLTKQYELLEKKAQLDNKAADAAEWRQKRLFTEQAKAGILEYQGKKEVDLKQYTQGPSTVRHSKEDLAVTSPETGVVHFFKPEEFRRAAFLLQEGKKRFNQEIPKNVRLMLDGKGYEEDGLAIELQNNWSMIKYALPEFAAELQKAQFENMATGGTGALVPGPGQQQPTRQSAGTQAATANPAGDLSFEEKSMLMLDLQGVYNSNYSNYKKTTEMSKRIKQAYKAKGIDKPIREIDQEVVELMRYFESLKTK